MKLARMLLWAICALMCAVGVLLFTDLSDLLGQVVQPRRVSETEPSASSSFQVAAQLAPAAHQPEVAPSSPVRANPDGESAEIASRKMAPPPVSPVLGVSLAAPADIASQQQDAPNELYLTPPAQNAPHAILPDVKPVTVPTETVAARETPATADVTELPSAVENPSPDAPKDEFVMIISAASLRDGPSATARLIGRAYAGARARVASRDSGWAQIVDPASGHSGWVNASVLVPSATTETAATENPSGGPTEGALDHSLEDGSAPTAKSAQSIRTSKHAAKRKRHKASHVYYGRPRLAFRFFLRRNFRR
jgi:hypothetical protein